MGAQVMMNGKNRQVTYSSLLIAGWLAGHWKQKTVSMFNDNQINDDHI